MTRKQARSGQPAVYNATPPVLSDGDDSALNVDQFANLKVVQSGVYPDSTTLFDDNFTNGFDGWQQLWGASGTGLFTTGRSTPLSLSSHGTFGGHSLLLQTNDKRADTYGSQCFAIKRMTMQYQRSVTRLVDFEVWFSYGSNNPNDSATAGTGGAPRNILFAIDTQTPGSSSTAIQTGQRCYFIAMWRQIAGTSYVRTADWYLNTSSEAYNGKSYGDALYVSPDSGCYVPTGFVSDFPYNGNKRNVQYFKLSVDVVNQEYISIQANDKVFDLQRCPSQSNGPVDAPISVTDTDFNDPGFNGGLNGLVAINNRTDTDTTASFMEVHRTRMTYR